MPNFRVRPVTIEAELFDGTEECVRRLSAWMGVCLMYRPREHRVLIETPHGNRTAAAGDWIVRATDGGFYPCEPRVFAETYDAVP